MMMATWSLVATCVAFHVFAGIADTGNFLSSLGGMDFNQAISQIDKRDEAIKRQDWSAAAISAGRNLGGETDFSRASNRLCLAMLYWNDDNPAMARSTLKEAIDVMKYGSQLGGGCEARAVQLLAKMQSRDPPSKFSVKDLIGGGGVLDFVMELPYAQSMRNLNALKAHYNRLMQRMDSELRTLNTEARINAGQARAYARQQYQKATGNTFSPSNPPSSGTSARDSWDSCKRIYDIFGK